MRFFVIADNCNLEKRLLEKGVPNVRIPYIGNRYKDFKWVLFIWFAYPSLYIFLNLRLAFFPMPSGIESEDRYSESLMKTHVVKPSSFL